MYEKGKNERFLVTKVCPIGKYLFLMDIELLVDLGKEENSLNKWPQGPARWLAGQA